MRKILRFASLLVLFLAAVYICCGADLYFRQDKYIYHPEKKWKTTPAAEGLAFEDLTLTSSDGVRISAWYVPVEAAKGSVIFCHGNARNISAEIEAIQMFRSFGFNVLLPDYRGYGKSEGHPSEEGTYRDAQAAWDWLTGPKKETPSRIVICGRSLGAAIAAELTSKNKPEALILEAAFTSLPDAGQDLHPYFPVKLLSRYRYDTLGKIKNIHCPILIVHSHDDELIPFRHGQKLYAAAQGKKEFLEIGGPHKGGYKPTLGKYQAGMREFLESLR